MKLVQRSLSKFVLKGMTLGLAVVVQFTTAQGVAATTRILPLITLYSSQQEGEVYNWWAENSSVGEMKVLSDEIFHFLEKSSLLKGRYLSQQESLQNLDVSLQISVLTREQKLDFAKKAKAGLIVSGDLRFSQSPLINQGIRIEARLELLRVKTAEVLAESLRIMDVPTHEYRLLMVKGVSSKAETFQHIFSDLHEKMENYKPGHRPPAQTHLVVMGFLDEAQMSLLKEKIKRLTSKIDAVKTLSLERGQFVLTVEGVNPAELGEALRQTSWRGYSSQVVSTDASSVVFDIKAKNTLQ